jgi:hypothetical protein
MPQTLLVPRSNKKYINKIIGLFGSSIIGYWPLNERAGAVAYDLSGNARHGAYTGVDLAQAGVGDRQVSPYFDGVNDYVDIYSPGLAGAFNGAEGTIMIWMRVLDLSKWTPSSSAFSMLLRTDANNLVQMYISSTANNFNVAHVGGGTSKIKLITGMTSLKYLHFGLTWSYSTNRARAFYGGVQFGGDMTGLGVWVGALNSATCLLGSGSKTPTGVHNGWLAHSVALNREATPAEMLASGRL